MDDVNLVLASGAATSELANGAGITIDGAEATMLYSHNNTNIIFNKQVESSVGFKGDGSNLTGISADSAGGFAYNQYDSTSSVIYNPNGISGFLVASGSTVLSPLSASVPTSINLSGSWENGMVLYIKAPSNASDWNLTINASGSDRIDGEESIVLESDYAAVTLLRCHSSRWSIV